MARREDRLLNTLNTVASVLNFIVVVIVTFETVTRFSTFLREWKPAKKRRMGFFHEKQREVR